MSIEIFKKWLEKKENDLFNKLAHKLIKNDVLSLNNEVIEIISSLNKEMPFIISEIEKEFCKEEDKISMSKLFSLLNDYTKEKENEYVNMITDFIKKSFENLKSLLKAKEFIFKDDFIYNPQTVYFIDEFQNLTNYVNFIEKTEKLNKLIYLKEVKNYITHLNKVDKQIISIKEIFENNENDKNDENVIKIQERIDEYFKTSDQNKKILNVENLEKIKPIVDNLENLTDNDINILFNDVISNINVNELPHINQLNKIEESYFDCIADFYLKEYEK